MWILLFRITQKTYKLSKTNIFFSHFEGTRDEKKIFCTVVWTKCYQILPTVRKNWIGPHWFLTPLVHLLLHQIPNFLILMGCISQKKAIKNLAKAFVMLCINLSNERKQECEAGFCRNRDEIYPYLILDYFRFVNRDVVLIWWSRYYK